MNLSDIRYERLRGQDYFAARELLSQDADAGAADLLQALDDEPELFIGAFIADKLVALVYMEAPTVESSLYVFVAPHLRRLGIGTAAAEFAENQLRTGGARTVNTSFRSGGSGSLTFALKQGYNRYYSLICMQRTGSPFPEEAVAARPYTDEDFVAAHSLYAAAFHEMRVRVGCFPDSVIAQPSEEKRNAWKEDVEDRFVYVLGGEIAAYSHLCGNEICSVSVRPDLQGQGTGKKFIKYLCNVIHQRGYATVNLSCVAGNEAKYLYDHLEFAETHVKEYMRKALGST